MASKKDKIINDAVFGTISLMPICVKIIDTPEFQRLRYIQQLGGASYVYPSANHSRFQHSIGVYHVAKQMMEKLKEKQEQLRNDFPDDVEEDSIIDDIDVKCVCIAALCHDLGHGPFSHAWEMFVKRANPAKKWKHEKTSTELLKQIWKRLDSSYKAEFKTNDVLFIEEMIKGPEKQEPLPDTEANLWPYKGREKSKSFLYEIVANEINGIDVDKFAYLTQDSYFLGIKTSFEYERLIQMVQVLKTPDGNKICFKDSEETNIYYMFLARWNLHHKAYRHRVTRLVEKMLIDAFIEVDDDPFIIAGEKKKLSNTVDDPKVYINIVDSVFHRILELDSKHPARKLIDRIQQRDLYNQVHEVGKSKDFKLEDEDIAKIQEGILLDIKGLIDLEGESCLNGFSSESFDIDVHKFSIGMGDKDPMDSVWFYKYEEIEEGKLKPVCITSEKRQHLSSLLTKNFQEVMVSLIWKPSNLSVKVKDALKESFKKRLDEHNMKKA